MNNFTTNTYEMKREIVNFSKILILKVNATNNITLATTFRITLALSFRLTYLYLLSINE